MHEHVMTHSRDRVSESCDPFHRHDTHITLIKQACHGLAANRERIVNAHADTVRLRSDVCTQEHRIRYTYIPYNKCM